MDHEVLVVERQRDLDPLARDRVLERLGDVEVQGVAEFVGLASRVGLHPRRVFPGLVGPDAGLAHRSEQVPEGAVPEEVEPLPGQIEVDLAGGAASFVHLPRTGRVAGGARHPGRVPAQGDVPLVHQLPDDLVEEVGDLVQHVGIAGTVAPEFLDHFGRQLAALHQRPQDGLFQSLDRGCILQPGPAPIGMEVRPSGEAPVQEELGELFDEALQVEGVEPPLPVLGVGGEAHDEQ